MSVLPDVIIFAALCLIAAVSASSSPLSEPEVSHAVNWSSRRHLHETSSCKTGNQIDDCYRCDPDWNANRKRLADCAVGFGRNAIGGRDGDIYNVNDPSDDPLNPKPGTLRYAAIQEQPLWIIFDHDMAISLKQDLQMASYKTIDGRGHNVQISYGPCLTLYNVTNVIIHNIYIHHCVPARRFGNGGYSDGDGISIFGSRDIWIDHCTFEKCRDGLIDAVYGSTAITISNNYMLNHNEVMLMGHSDEFEEDKNMQVTIAFNYFGEGLVQRMPRCRHGYFHILNNIYKGWQMYAIGGSANPTINSQGNVFIASDDRFTKEVTKRETLDGSEDWKTWNWKSEGDLMINGAYFTISGEKDPSSYIKASSMVARPASFLQLVHPPTGVLSCTVGRQC